MVVEKYRCIVCGRVFPKGQGVVVKYGDISLCFHSNKCVSKFFKHLLETAPYDDLGKHVKAVYREFEEKLRAVMEKRVKKI